jgi:hypothetical protein
MFLWTVRNDDRVRTSLARVTGNSGQGDVSVRDGRADQQHLASKHIERDEYAYNIHYYICIRERVCDGSDRGRGSRERERESTFREFN